MLYVKPTVKEIQMNLLAEKYKITELIMQSANGTIWGGFMPKTHRPVVIKQFPKKSISEYHRVNGRKCPSEIYYHLKAFTIDPVTVIEPIEWFEDHCTYLIVMERPIGWIDLFGFCNRFGPQTEDTARRIWTQIATAIEKLHRGGICHGDIKDENILINPHTLKVKLIDFGCAQKTKPIYSRCRGTPHYWPPEWFKFNAYRPEPLTVWSLAAILYLLLCGEWKFINGSHQRSFKKEIRLSKSAQKLLNSMLCRHDTSRITLKNILKSDWLK